MITHTTYIIMDGDTFCQSSPSDHPSSVDESEKYVTSVPSSLDSWSCVPDSFFEEKNWISAKSKEDLEKKFDFSTPPPSLTIPDGVLKNSAAGRCPSIMHVATPEPFRFQDHSLRRHVDMPPTDRSNTQILSRDDDLPESLKDVVAPHTYDGYEGLELHDLDNDAISPSCDVWEYKAWYDDVHFNSKPIK